MRPGSFLNELPEALQDEEYLIFRPQVSLKQGICAKFVQNQIFLSLNKIKNYYKKAESGYYKGFGSSSKKLEDHPSLRMFFTFLYDGNDYFGWILLDGFFYLNALNFGRGCLGRGCILAS